MKRLTAAAVYKSNGPRFEPVEQGRPSTGAIGADAAIVEGKKTGSGRPARGSKPSATSCVFFGLNVLVISRSGAKKTQRTMAGP